MEEIKTDQKNPEQNAEQKSGYNKNLVYILIAIVAIIIIFSFVKKWVEEDDRSRNWLGDERKLSRDLNNQDYPNASNGAGNQAGDLVQTKGDANTGIEVIVNYEKDKSQSTSIFRIGFSTHVIDYSGYNFNENVVLRDSQNKEYKALNITTEGSGHHQAIEATFPLVSSPFKLVVKNLAGVPERDFDFK